MGIVLYEIFDDDIYWNAIQIAVENLAAPVDIIPNTQKPTYNENYVSHTIPGYTLSGFKNHFRMSRQNVAELCPAFASYTWLIDKQESFLAVSDRFAFLKGTVYYIFLQVLNAIIELK
ncbi:unnamed protein product [Psylliodes chrysocephalus]|uniref:Uncharacterized protein n=1 Tax=Psylliodes chrysocephalus TaxID=3402493 RepID=A0A9P0D3C9_9CUCU|nr:unnamed protein product [Psylliodes chrysocephala]